MRNRAGIVSLAGIVAAALWCGSRPADADIVFLRNGRPIQDAWIVHERGDWVTIVIIKDGVEKGRLTIQRRQIRYVEQVGARPDFLKARRKQSRPKVKFESLNPETAKIPAPKSKGEPKPEKTQAAEPVDKTRVGTFAADEKTRKKLDGLFAEFNSDDENTRTRARGELVAIGKPAIPGLIQRLTDKSLRVRTQAARGLRDMKDDGATKPLIEALYAGTPEKGMKVPIFNRHYMRSVSQALQSITGKNFNYMVNSKNRAAPAVDKWVKWWDEVKETYPEQFTDPVIDKDDDESKKKWTEARKLKLDRTKFSPPPKKR